MYYLIFKQGLSANTLYRIKKGEAISTKTIDTLCYILDCNVEDIIEFVLNYFDENIDKWKYIAEMSEDLVFNE